LIRLNHFRHLNDLNHLNGLNHLNHLNRLNRFEDRFVEQFGVASFSIKLFYLLAHLRSIVLQGEAPLNHFDFRTGFGDWFGEASLPLKQLS
jgi:hypothetical protein